VKGKYVRLVCSVCKILCCHETLLPISNTDKSKVDSGPTTTHYKDKHAKFYDYFRRTYLGGKKNDANKG